MQHMSACSPTQAWVAHQHWRPLDIDLHDVSSRSRSRTWIADPDLIRIQILDRSYDERADRTDPSIHSYQLNKQDAHRHRNVCYCYYSYSHGQYHDSPSIRRAVPAEPGCAGYHAIGVCSQLADEFEKPPDSRGRLPHRR